MHTSLCTCSYLPYDFGYPGHEFSNPSATPTLIPTHFIIANEVLNTPTGSTKVNTNKAGCSEINLDHPLLENNTNKRNNSPSTMKPFICERCEKRFTRNYNLKSHRKTHDTNREYSFPCSKCPKRFVRRTDRDRHDMSVHLQEKRFQCPFCLRRFNRKDTCERQVQ